MQFIAGSTLEHECRVAEQILGIDVGKHQLPVALLRKQVNTYINLPTYCDPVVVGSHVVLTDQVNTTVVDFISYVF